MRARDYSAEYNKRKQKAKAAGWGSYYQQRRARAESTHLKGPSRTDFLQRARSMTNTPSRAKQWRLGGKLIRQARKAREKGDNILGEQRDKEADRIARQLGFKTDPQRPARSAFWYHGD